MADPVTDNFGFVLPTVGGDTDIWGGALNNGDISPIDAVLGANLPVTINTNDVNLTNSQFQNAIFVLSGVLTGNRSLIVPLSANSATLACGGRFVVVNNTTGNFNVTVKTAAAGSTGVTVPQGFSAFLYSDKTNVGYSTIGVPGFAAAVSGNPNGQLAGTAGSATTNAQFAYDYVGGVLYVCTTTGDSTHAVWTNPVSGSLPQPEPEGYLTPVSNTPVITSDSLAATAIYYTPFKGAWAAIHNGIQIVPYRFTQLQLTLSASQAALGIYDVYLAYNSGVPVIGTGPSWVAGTSGSVTAGSCARGTGAGGAAINRDSTTGLWVNTASMSLIYNTGSGNNTITVAAGQGIYLGSIFMDAAAGQVTCHRSYGQSRKWGISNAYNREPIILQAGDTTPTWAYNTATYRSSNGSAANSATVFCGLAEEEADVVFTQFLQADGTGAALAGTASFINVGIGLNSTSVPNGRVGVVGASRPQNSTSFNGYGNGIAEAVLPPALGINTFTCLESGTGTSSVTTTFSGTNTNMLLKAAWNG